MWAKCRNLRLLKIGEFRDVSRVDLKRESKRGLPDLTMRRTSSKARVFRKTNNWGLDNITQNGKTTQPNNFLSSNFEYIKCYDHISILFAPIHNFNSNILPNRTQHFDILNFSSCVISLYNFILNTIYIAPHLHVIKNLWIFK